MLLLHVLRWEQHRTSLKRFRSLACKEHKRVPAQTLEERRRSAEHRAVREPASPGGPVHTDASLAARGSVAGRVSVCQELNGPFEESSHHSFCFL